MAPQGSHSRPHIPQRSDAVQVALRIRPPASSDLTVPPRFQRVVVNPVPGSSATLAVDASPAPRQSFSFDRVLGPADGQADVWNSVHSSIDRFLDGFNCTILAYGQTSSGKSYTMGTDRLAPEDLDLGPQRLGIIPRAITSVFERINDLKAGSFTAKNSFVEIYNEELIDLLAGDASASERPQVVIREDKSGNILWSGLREIKVNSAADVMANLEAGTALRQTGSTEMNAQSSRSHSIFTLTLTQRKWNGSGPPPPAASSNQSPRPNRFSQPGASSLPRPASPMTISKRTSAIPTPNRPGTPSDRPASRIARPHSVLGGRASPAPFSDDDRKLPSSDIGDWITVTSKFHFVDLAGSERLKRTSAVGERVKEGISINSGLHALGNVISALGDPAKAKHTTHVPYRDSKLTRLLQDSIGGNALTFFIACVSPIEYNVQETLNTLKYANRARNIKNHAQINEVEVGWDDVDYLQNLVTKLRAELTAIRVGGNNTGTDSSKSTAIPSQLLELQQNHSELSQKYAALTAEVAKYRQQQQQQQQSSSSSSSNAEGLSPEDFAKAVEPVVEEYEKSISALETQLSLTKAALIHSEDAMKEQDERLAAEQQTNSANETIIQDLKDRLAKIAEREASTERYVKDLEARLKTKDEDSDSHVALVAELRKEVGKYRDVDTASESYIRELEARLAKSEESAAELQAKVSALEKQMDQKEAALVEMEDKLEKAQHWSGDGENDKKMLLAELDSKEVKLADLEKALTDAKGLAETASREGQRLRDEVKSHEMEKNQLHTRISELEEQREAKQSSSSSVLVDTNGGLSEIELRLREAESQVSPAVTASSGSVSSRSSSTSSRGNSDDETSPTTPMTNLISKASHESLKTQMAQLQQRYDETLSRLEEVETKYKDSVKEISDLAAQIDEESLVRGGQPGAISQADSSAVAPSDTTRGSTSTTTLQSPFGSPLTPTKWSATDDSISPTTVVPPGSSPNSNRPHSYNPPSKFQQRQSEDSEPVELLDSPIKQIEDANAGSSKSENATATTQSSSIPYHRSSISSSASSTVSPNNRVRRSMPIVSNNSKLSFLGNRSPVTAPLISTTPPTGLHHHHHHHHHHPHHPFHHHTSNTSITSRNGTWNTYSSSTANNNTANNLTHLRSASLSQELLLAQSPQSHLAGSSSSPSSPNSATGVNSRISMQHQLSNSSSSDAQRAISPTPSRSPQRPPSQQANHVSPNQRTYESLEREVKQLQQVLDARDKEIIELESTINNIHNVTQVNGHIGSREESGDDVEDEEEVLELGDSATEYGAKKRGFDLDDSIAKGDNDDDDDLPPSSPTSYSSRLSVNTLETFKAFRDELAGMRRESLTNPQSLSLSLQQLNGNSSTSRGVSPIPGSGNDGDMPRSSKEHFSSRLDELMRSMAKKESHHREVVDTLENELSNLRRNHDELTKLSKDQVLNTSREIELLRVNLEQSHVENEDLKAQLNTLQLDLEKKKADLAETDSNARQLVEKTTAGLVEKLTREKEAQHREHQDALQTLRDDHDKHVQGIFETHQRALTDQAEKHKRSIDLLETQQQEAIRIAEMDRSAALVSLRNELEAIIRRKDDEAREANERFAIEMSTLKQNSTNEGENATAEALEKLKAEHASILTRREQDYDRICQELRQHHAELMATKDKQHNETIAKLDKENEDAFTRTIEDYSLRTERLKKEKDKTMQKMADDHRAEVAKLLAERQEELDRREKEHSQKLEEMRSSNETQLGALQDQHGREREKLVSEHSEAMEKALTERETSVSGKMLTSMELLKAEHAQALESLANNHRQQLEEKQRSSDKEIQKLISAHDQEKNQNHQRNRSDLDTRESEYFQEMEIMKESYASLERTLRDEKLRHEEKLKAVSEKHKEDLESRRKEHKMALQLLRSEHEALAERLRSEQELEFESQLHTNNLELLEGHQREKELLSQRVTEREEHISKLEVALREEQKSNRKRLEELNSELINAKRVQTGNTSSKSSSNPELQEALDALSMMEKELVRTQDEHEKLQKHIWELEGGNIKDRDASSSDSGHHHELRFEIERIRDERDILQAEREKQDVMLREMASKLENGYVSHHYGDTGRSTPVGRSASQASDRNIPGSRYPATNGASKVAIAKQPPPTPPPLGPPPALPKTSIGRSSSSSSNRRGSSDVTNSNATPPSNVRSSVTSVTTDFGGDPRIQQKLEEQESQIIKLTKQLEHCEGDLKANMDLVNTLESALNDSERNLRKARMQMSELTKNRDSLQSTNDSLRIQLADATQEIEEAKNNLINSQVESDNRLAAERQEREMARERLESRMDAMRNRKNKFNCF